MPCIETSVGPDSDQFPTFNSQERANSQSVDFNYSNLQRSWTEKASALGQELSEGVAPVELIARAARAGILDARGDLVAAVAAVETLARASAAAAITYAMHIGVALAQPADERLARGDLVGAISLSSEDVPAEQSGVLSGRAAWVGPVTDGGVAIVGARREREIIACVVMLDSHGVRLERMTTAALRGFPCARVEFDAVSCTVIGSPRPIMAGVRVLLAAAGLGMGRRALREALQAARAHSRTGAGGEQTVQGLLADAATELDAASLLTWKAAQTRPPSLAAASMAKLAATEATQRAVARATQVVGSDTFRSGHIVERLAQEVRALELLAGRTESLREAVADEVLPPQVL